MLEKIKKRVLKWKCSFYHRLGNYCYRKVDEYGPENNDYWLGLTAKYTQKELDAFARLFGEETC